MSVVNALRQLNARYSGLVRIHGGHLREAGLRGEQIVLVDVEEVVVVEGGSLRVDEGLMTLRQKIRHQKEGKKGKLFREKATF